MRLEILGIIGMIGGGLFLVYVGISFVFYLSFFGVRLGV